MAFEVLNAKANPPPSAVAVLDALRACVESRSTQVYRGKDEWLALYGVGYPPHSLARDVHVRSGRHVLHFDLGYFSRRKVTGYFKACLDRDHPQHLLDRAPSDASRWLAHGIGLAEKYDPDGPIILVGMGRKARVHLGDNWELRAFKRLRERFPGRRIIYRPKLEPDPVRPDCERDADTPIAELLTGASLVVCRHSNVAVDAVIAGVPFEAEDGAAMWLAGKEYSRENRLDFLQRLAWFQWRPTEMAEAVRFMTGLAACV